MSQAVVHRLNTVTNDFNKKIACGNLSRQRHSLYIVTVQNKVADLREQSDMRQLHFKQQLHCKKLETQLAHAKRCQLHQHRENERRERIKIDTLKKICLQVTTERTAVHNDLIAMQVAWTKLKLDINSLKEQVGDNGKVFECYRVL